ncbi:hypothetical protein LMG7974_00327 [Campylobacter majalis]|uniref:Integral membrane protein n=1 Tax=Campylobacter majalis TaxID=2790656 RepID=A0ABN7K4I0_9BACT|nr:hypothetical protein [Campylobacter majalis]CAD7287448.1 hypothetical protein LMG7974_00327 [Campylobacter majalis]
MQVLSSMRRNSSDLRYLGYVIGITCLFGYEIVTSIFVFLPPLIGVFFTYMIIEYAKKMQKSYIELGFGWYLSIAFLLFAELTHGYYLFSSIVGFFIFYYFAVDWLSVTFKHRKFLLILFVACGYFMTFLISCILCHMQGIEILNWGFEYAVYIAIESIIAIVLFKDRLI